MTNNIPDNSNENNISNQEEKFPVKEAKIVSLPVKDVQKKTSDAVDETILTSEVDKVAHVLREKFGSTCNVTQTELAGNPVVSLLTKGIEKKSVDQKDEIVLTFTKSGKINLGLNPYGHLDEYHIDGQNFTLEDVMNELDNFASFLLTGEVSKSSKLKREVYLRNDASDDDIAAYLPKEKFVSTDGPTISWVRGDSTKLPPEKQ